MTVTLLLMVIVFIWLCVCVFIWIAGKQDNQRVLKDESNPPHTSDEDDMKPKQLNGFFKRGSSWSFSITRKNPSGFAVDLSGVTLFRAIFRTESVDGTALLTMDSTNGLSILVPANGTIQFDLTPLQTVLFPVGTKVYFDIELTYGLTGVVWQSPTYFIIAEEQVT